jgi:hypothetical protein
VAVADLSAGRSARRPLGRASLRHSGRP